MAASLHAQTADTLFLQSFLQAHKDSFGDLLDHPDKYEIQIVYTQIDQKGDKRIFTPYHYRVDPNKYFYPASTVKMPAAFMALEKINQLNIPALDKHSTVFHQTAHPPQTAARMDTTAEDSLPSIAQYIRKIFLISDNDANNRLYEFLGQEYFNRSLHQKGYTDVRLVHRLGAEGVPFNAETNRYTNPVSFYAGDRMVYHQGEVHSQTPEDLQLKGEKKGLGFQKGGQIVEQAFDFSQKNFIALTDLNDILKAVLFPESVAPEKRFDLTEADYHFLYKYLSMRPRESKSPQYDKADGYVKFFIYGGEAEQMPPHIRIFNKVGWAYGYLTDVAYILDLKNEVEFMVSATIHVNDNQIFNDNQYQYESIGLPFFIHLGKLLYEHELKRPRSQKSNLQRFQNINYQD